jgi:hypothetical protein
MVRRLRGMNMSPRLEDVVSWYSYLCKAIFSAKQTRRIQEYSCERHCLGKGSHVNATSYSIIMMNLEVIQLHPRY